MRKVVLTLALLALLAVWSWLAVALWLAGQFLDGPDAASARSEVEPILGALSDDRFCRLGGGSAA